MTNIQIHINRSNFNYTKISKKVELLLRFITNGQENSGDFFLSPTVLNSPKYNFNSLITTFLSEDNF